MTLCWACRAGDYMFWGRDTKVSLGHEKKFKNHQNCNFGLNEIKYLQLLILAKRDFSSRPLEGMVTDIKLQTCGNS
jgi:hypothetical protein